MKEVYTGIRSRIEAECSSIKHVRLFNDQFTRSNNDSSEFNNEQAFPYPCVFIQFIGDNEIVSQGAGAKRLRVPVRLYIGFESYTYEDLLLFDIVNEVKKAIENYSTQYFGPLQYLAQRMDHNHNNVYIYELDYECIYEDDTSYIKKDTITINPPFTLVVNKDLDIDNIVIRTGDGV